MSKTARGGKGRGSKAKFPDNIRQMPTPRSQPDKVRYVVCIAGHQFVITVGKEAVKTPKSGCAPVIEMRRRA